MKNGAGRPRRNSLCGKALGQSALLQPVEIVVTTDHGKNDAHEDGDDLVHLEPFRLVGWLVMLLSYTIFRHCQHPTISQ